MEVKDGGGGGGGGENGEKVVGELGVDDGFNEFTEGSGVELVAGELALELPGGAIGVEDAVAEEVAEGAVEGGAFVVEGEVGLEDVLDDGGVGGEHVAGA